jgi:hypothetical protein
VLRGAGRGRGGGCAEALGGQPGWWMLGCSSAAAAATEATSERHLTVGARRSHAALGDAGVGPVGAAGPPCARQPGRQAALRRFAVQLQPPHPPRLQQHGHGARQTGTQAEPAHRPGESAATLFSRAALRPRKPPPRTVCRDVDVSGFT